MKALLILADNRAREIFDYLQNPKNFDERCA